MKHHNINQTDFRAYFQELNDGIFSVLFRVCGSRGTGVIIADDFTEMRLCAREDCAFVRELAATHGFDVTVRGGRCGCCPCLS